MITNLFRKSTPLNYALILIFLVGFFFTYQFSIHQWNISGMNILEITGKLLLIIGTFFISNFIIKKNELSKDSSYTIFFYLLFLLLLPSIFDNGSLLFSNLFIAFALRRLVSMQSLKFTKEKIFDASIWILLASIFNFWCIIFMALVLISILFYVARDYRNWFIPLIAFGSVSMIFWVYSMLINDVYYTDLIQNAFYCIEFDYFELNVKNIAFAFVGAVFLFFLLSILFTLSHRPIILHSTYRLIITALIISTASYLLSCQKQPEMALFLFTPLSILATSHIEYVSSKLHQEIILWTMTISAVVCFFLQL